MLPRPPRAFPCPSRKDWRSMFSDQGAQVALLLFLLVPLLWSSVHPPLFPQKCHFQICQSPFLSSRSNSSFTTQMTLRFHGEETHLQGLTSPHAVSYPHAFICFPHAWASPASVSPPAHLQGPYQLHDHPENPGLSLPLTPQWPFIGPLRCLSFFSENLIPNWRVHSLRAGALSVHLEVSALQTGEDSVL